MDDTRAKRREERVKLFATALSNVGVATIVAGFISPLLSGRVRLAGAAGALLLGLALHMAAQLMLHYVVRVGAVQPSHSDPEAEP